MAAFRPISRETISDTELKFWNWLVSAPAPLTSGPNSAMRPSRISSASPGGAGPTGGPGGALELVEADDEGAVAGLLDACLLVAEIGQRFADIGLA